MSKYDDFDYHVGGAQANGQPDDNAFTHIGFMLSWLIRGGLGVASPAERSEVELTAGRLLAALRR